ncbi:acyltransferase family protein [Gracilibacillus sp. YIM 98692]|uniref:acyltransferase family protein n=1 Tax=Gracilibacillus sp. YIM 98692 TaxID=2663532 RepID=UPI0013D0A80E|nr:acyltransferase family protein [Gracilibacillus sp. YIM 98692]
MIKEWNYIRVLACLSIVFLHSNTYTRIVVGRPDIGDIYDIIRILFCYATPTFILLSEIILANKYHQKIPKGFFTKRLKFILIPYIIFGLIDAILTKQQYPYIDLLLRIKNNLLFGTFEGFFVLVIMQFYILHFLITRFRIPAAVFVPFSFLIMIIHHSIVKLEPAFLSDVLARERILFSAWIGYFAIAYLIGRYYNTIKEQLSKYKISLFIGVLLSIAVVVLSFYLGERTVNSRRLDLIFLTTFVSLFLISIHKWMPNLSIINTISNYSFGIYLIHWQVQRFIAPIVVPYFGSTSLQVGVLFIVTLSLTMTIMKLISFIPYSQFIIGNVQKRKYQQVSNEKKAA